MHLYAMDEPQYLTNLEQIAILRIPPTAHYSTEQLNYSAAHWPKADLSARGLLGTVLGDHLKVLHGRILTGSNVH